LAACDILVSPQVRNKDGTPFFGSPTKLFEYMAMGKAIAASNLDQMGEILQHEKTALLYEPGDTEALQRVLVRLMTDKDLCRTLGENAHQEVLQKYTWRLHTQKIIEALKQRCSVT
jgi:glycosyltransferase involved in cell wall biosynthesis